MMGGLQHDHSVRVWSPRLFLKKNVASQPVKQSSLGSLDEHAVAVGVEAVMLGDGMTVGGEHALAAA
jgi:hypothetical protein